MMLSVFVTSSVARKLEAVSISQMQQLMADAVALAYARPSLGDTVCDSVRVGDKLTTVTIGEDAYHDLSSLPTRTVSVSVLLGRALICTLSRNRLRSEADYAASWAKDANLAYSLEVVCSVGRADIVFANSRHVVEAKFWPGWKSALGQVLAYKWSLGCKQASLLLIGMPDLRCEIESVNDCCATLGVGVVWLPLNWQPTYAHL